MYYSVEKIRMARVAVPIAIVILTIGIQGHIYAQDAVLGVVGGNSASNELLDLDFANQLATPLNDDANSRASLRSFELVPNLCAARQDVAVADTNRGELLLYGDGEDGSPYNSGTVFCTGGGCPSRPDGLSLSDGGVLAVADTGTAGTTPTIWVFPPAPAGDPECMPFGAQEKTNAVCLPDGGGCTSVTGIRDTAFVSSLSGGLNPGDLVFLTQGPNALARYTAAQVKLLLDTGNDPGAPEVLIDAAGLQQSGASALTFIPGTATSAFSDELLIAYTGGVIRKFRFSDNAGAPQVAALGDFVNGLGNGPLGIDAGIQDPSTFVIVADRQNGKYLKFDTAGNLLSQITTGVQNPQGVTINSDAVNADECDIEEETQFGCQIRQALNLFYNNLNVTSDDKVLAGIVVVDDPRTSDRDISFSELGVPGNYIIPGTLRGLPLAGGSRVLVIAAVAKDFDIEPGTFVEAREEIATLVPEVADCNNFGTRMYYSPDPSAPHQPPEGRTAYDTTFNCENPARSSGRDNSPIIIGASSFFERASSTNKRERRRVAKDIQREAFARAAALESVVDARLPGGNNILAPLESELAGYLKTINRKIKSKDYVKATESANQGAIAISDAQALFTTTNVGVGNETVYGDLLSRFLALAFFTFETGEGEDYCPPDVGLAALACGSPNPPVL